MPQIGAISSGVKSLMCSAKALKPEVCASTYCRSYKPSVTIVLRMPLSIATSVPGLNCSMCVAWPRAMVDIVVAEPGAHQLLEQIGLLVRALGGAEAGQRAITITLADLLQ